MVAKHSLETPFTEKELHSVILPLVTLLEKKRARQITRNGKESTLLVGFQGGQGTGKTSVVRLLEHELEKKGYRVLQFSLDDFYTSYSTRYKQSQNTQNPFYKIARGMPGTHRVNELRSTLAAIHNAKSFMLPSFDKSLHNGYGDIVSETRYNGRYDIVLFEGWCLGITFLSLTKALEILKKYNVSLASLTATQKDFQEVLKNSTLYKECWKQIDYWVCLRPRSLKYHLQWRIQQEQELKENKKQGMSIKELTQFVSTYLPVTAILSETLNAHVFVRINKDHKFYKIEEVKK